MTGQLSQGMQILTSSRGSINAMPATITSESSTSPVELIMATVYKICAGPIEPQDQHYHCIACLGLAHAKAALDESDCGHCGPVGPPRYGLAAYSGWGPSRRAAKSNGRPIPRFPSPRTASAPANIEEFVSFGQEEGDDSMSISASEREDWAGSEPDLPGVRQKSLSGISLTLGISGPHESWLEGVGPLLPPMYTSSWWKCSLYHTGHLFPRGWSEGPRLCALSSRQGDRRCTPVSCSSQDPRLRHQPSLEAMINI